MANNKLEFSAMPVANVTRTRFIEKQVRGKEWVSYGTNNKYPEYLWGLYTSCPTQQAIIDAKTAFTMGGGLCCGDEIVNSAGESLEEVVRKAVFDMHLFGGFAIQVIYNQAGDILELYWADFSKLRINDKGNKVYWCDNWGGYQSPTIEYDVFNPKMTNKTTQIFYYRGTTCRSVYPIPCYISAMDAINTEIEIQNFHLHSIKNGFSVNAVVNFNSGVPDEEERKQIEAKLNAKFSGSDNAGRTLISWNESKENACTVERLESDNFDKKFEQLAKDTQEAIFVAHRITSGTLLGRLPTNTGFTKNEYREAFEVFNTTVIKPYQKELITCLKKIYPGKEVQITPFYLESE
jgi:hypothetical protein